MCMLEMDFRISKTKTLKKCHEPRSKWPKNTSVNNSLTEKDFGDLETLPVIDHAKTPQRNTDKKINSPQFRVGWNDGFDSSVLPGAESPVIPSVQQRIRRCPDELYKDTKKTLHAKNLKIERDRELELGCVTWAKNLLEISLEPQNESAAEKAKTPTADVGDDISQSVSSVQRPEESTSDNRIDIMDDAVDELMVLCSQAVEEEATSKRPCSSECYQPKKQKLSESSDCESLSNEKVTKPIESRVSKVLHFDQNSIISPQNNAVIVKKSDKLVDSMDLFKCILDDDDEFSSFDFNYLDNIQNTNSQNRPPKSNFNASNPKQKYTKEQIEQRRLEAKKKLLFRKKHKSM